jgi:hypothetical protein
MKEVKWQGLTQTYRSITIKIICLISLTFLYSFSCNKYSEVKNIEYIDSELASMVLIYYAETNILPDSFDTIVDYHYQNHQYRRKNRGDYYGYSLGYKKIEDSEFLFHSKGPLRDVTSDDILLIYKIEKQQIKKISFYKNYELITYMISHELR